MIVSDKLDWKNRQMSNELNMQIFNVNVIVNDEAIWLMNRWKVTLLKITGIWSHSFWESFVNHIIITKTACFCFSIIPDN